MAALSPQERLKQLEALLKEKEEKKKELEKAAGDTEKELQEAQARIQEEIEELRRDDEIRELLAKMQDTSAALDRRMLEDFERKGLGRPKRFSVVEEEAPRPRKIEDSLDEMLADAPSGRPQPAGAVVYDLAERAMGGSLYDATNNTARTGLRRLEESMRLGNPLTDNQYQALNQLEEAARQGATNAYYSEDDPRKVYASQTVQQIEEIKRHMGVQIGDSYINAGDEDFGY